jgi:hypothetical protein
MFFGKKIRIVEHFSGAVHASVLMAGVAIGWAANVNGQSIHPPIGMP